MFPTDLSDVAYIETTLTIGTVSKTVDYSTAGYQANQNVLFSTQIDAASLATGEYQWQMQVTEHFSGGGTQDGPTIVGYIQIENRDSSPYGHGWTLHNIPQLHIQSAATGQDDGVLYSDGSGNMSFFFNQTINGHERLLTPDPLPNIYTLVKNSDGTYTLTYTDGSTSLFSADGMLTTHTDPAGNQTTYTYNPDLTVASSTDPEGRTTTFSYTGGLLTSTTDPWGA